MPVAAISTMIEDAPFFALSPHERGEGFYCPF